MARWWNSLRFRLGLLVVLGIAPALILVFHNYVEHLELANSVDASRQLLMRDLGWLAISLGLGLAAVWFFAYRFVMKKTDPLIHAARRLSEGDLTARTGLTSEDGEIGEVGIAFDRMAENLRGREAERDEALAQLRKEKELSDMIIDGLPGAFYILDREGHMKRWNKAVEELSGYSSAELARMDTLQVVGEETRALVQRAAEELFESTSEKGSVEATWASKSGARIPYLFTGKKIEIDGTDYLVGMGIDISERKRAEAAIRESEAKYRILVETANELICVVQDGRFVFANQRALTESGYSIEELTSKHFLEVVHPDDQDIPLKLYQKAMSGEEVRDASVFRMIDKWGRTRWGLVSVVLIQWDGRPAVLVLGTDITDLKQAEGTRRESEERYRTLFEEATDAIAIVRPQGEILDANPACCKLFGATKGEIVGSDVLQFYWNPADRKIFRREVDSKGFVRGFEVEIRRKDGSKRSCFLNSSLWKSEEGSILGYLSILHDVTESRLLREQLFQAQKMEAIGTLAGGMAHDFNNLLTIINGYAELLLADRPSDDPDYEDLKKIHVTGSRGADLIQRLLTLSRKAESKPRPMDLNRQIEHTEKLLERTIPKMIRIELSLSDDLETIHADPTQVEQVLMNLAVNARDAMPDGGILAIESKNVILDEDYCSRHLDALPGNHVMLSVSDSGHGMNDETVQRIFEPFFTTKETGKGTGLGLAMVHGIVKQHGGHITCRSEPGQGTTFGIYFPVAGMEPEPKTEPVTSPFPQGTETILLVDDEQFVRDFGDKLLRRAGYKVITATNGRDALAIYERERANISLVVLDLIMPEMGGKECFASLVQMNPQVKVVIASGYTSRGTAKAAEELGAKGFINKPYNMRELLQTVRGVIDAE